jgi:hypothetical protein
MHVLIALFIAIVLMKSCINRMIHGDDGWALVCSAAIKWIASRNSFVPTARPRRLMDQEWVAPLARPA